MSRPRLQQLRPRGQVLADRLPAQPAPSKRSGHRITGRVLQEARERIWLRDSGICGECGKLTNPPDFDLDHRIPLDAGGSNDDGNLQVLHREPCHKAKTARELANRYRPLPGTSLSLENAKRETTMALTRGFLIPYDLYD